MNSDMYKELPVCPMTKLFVPAGTKCWKTAGRSMGCGQSAILGYTKKDQILCAYNVYDNGWFQTKIGCLNPKTVTVLNQPELDQYERDLDSWNQKYFGITTEESRIAENNRNLANCGMSTEERRHTSHETLVKMFC